MEKLADRLCAAALRVESGWKTRKSVHTYKNTSNKHAVVGFGSKAGPKLLGLVDAPEDAKRVIDKALRKYDGDVGNSPWGIIVLVKPQTTETRKMQGVEWVDEPGSDNVIDWAKLS